MPLRKLKSTAKANKGIYEYYKASDVNKVTDGYFFSYTAEDGKTTKVKAKSDNLNDVRIERAQKIADVKAGKEDEDSKADSKVDDFITVYIDNREKQANSIKDKQKYFNHISPLLGKKLISKISVEDIQKLRKKLVGKNLSESTIANVLIILKAMLNYAEAIDMKTQRPFNKKVNNQTVLKVKKKRSTRVRVLTDKELEELFKLAEKKDSRLFFMMNMLYYTLQRPKSILSLKCWDVNLDMNRISLESIKGQQERYIPISKKLKPLLEEWLQDKEPSEPLINLSYGRLSTLSRGIFEPLNKKFYYKKSLSAEALKKAKDEAMKEFRHEWASFYSLRHTSATNVYQKNQDIKLVKELLGHSDLKMTEIYAKIGDSQMQGGVDAL